MAMFSSRPGMRRLVDRDESDLPVLRDEETILFTFPRIEFAFKASENKGKGILYVTSARFLWLSDTESIDLDVPFVMLHAVSKDTGTYPKPCIYCQLDVDVREDEDEDDAEPSECFLAPEDDDILMSIFDAFSQAAQMNPDPEEEEEEGEGIFQYGTDDFIYNEDEVNEGVQQAKLAEWESKLIVPSNSNISNNEEDQDGTDGTDGHVSKISKLA